MIFAFAYPTGPEHKYIRLREPSEHLFAVKTKQTLRGRLTSGRRGSRQRLPTYFIDRFLVSKAFFVAASKAWVYAQQHDGLHAYNDLMCSSRKVEVKGIVAAWVRELTISLLPQRLSRDLLLPSLECLTVVMSRDWLGRERKTTLELQEVAEYCRLRRLAGLKVFKILAEPRVSGSGPYMSRARYIELAGLDRDIAEANVRDLEALVKPQVQEAKDTSMLENTEDPGGLYPGSWVSDAFQSACVGSTVDA